MDGQFDLREAVSEGDADAATASFAAAVHAGLGRARKAIPSQYFYDRCGSELFERICDLEEYYPTRTEIAILDACCGEIGALVAARPTVIELGSGSSRKVKPLLDALREPAAYVPVDISREHLLASAEALARDYPDITVIPVWGDFARSFALPPLPEGPRLIFFPGSTIGNFAPVDAADLLAAWSRHLGEGGYLIIGVDLKKDPKRLEAAYDDAAGVTAAFNLNLLARANRELGADFDLDRFTHRALYDPRHGRVEMHLVSTAEQRVRVAGRSYAFAAGETIHTENSYKYTVEEFQRLAGSASYHSLAVFTDRDRLFSVHVLQVRGSAAETGSRTRE